MLAKGKTKVYEESFGGKKKFLLLMFDPEVVNLCVAARTWRSFSRHLGQGGGWRMKRILLLVRRTDTTQRMGTNGFPRYTCCCVLAVPAGWSERGRRRALAGGGGWGQAALLAAGGAGLAHLLSRTSLFVCFF